jgi:RNA polymerase sigma-70 factor (ECF subfamily)
VSRKREDWAGVLERLIAGDALACFKVGRLVTGFLVQWRAYDFEDEWPDLVQDVLMVVIAAVRTEKVRDPEALVGYIRSVARNKYTDRLRTLFRRHEGESLPWDDATAATHPSEPASEAPPEVSIDVRAAVGKLPEKKRLAVVGVYVEGKTYDQVADETGIPLGSVKRYLREGLGQLRRDLSARL